MHIDKWLLRAGAIATILSLGLQGWGIYRLEYPKTQIANPATTIDNSSRPGTVIHVPPPIWLIFLPPLVSAGMILAAALILRKPLRAEGYSDKQADFQPKPKIQPRRQNFEAEVSGFTGALELVKQSGPRVICRWEFTTGEPRKILDAGFPIIQVVLIKPAFAQWRAEELPAIITADGGQILIGIEGNSIVLNDCVPGILIMIQAEAQGIPQTVIGSMSASI